MQPFFTEICKLPVALFVACHSDWEKNLTLPKYSGIFSDLITLPPWNTSDAYRLVDKRLRDSAVDSESFRNPITRDSLNKLVSLRIVKTCSPRDWIIHIRRALENVPKEIDEITPAVISRVFSQTDRVKVAQIQYLLSQDFPNANKLFNLIIRFPSEEATKLLTVISHMYRNDLPRPLKDENCSAVGYEELPLLIEKLREQRIVHEAKRTSTPRKIGKGAVETLYEEVYRLNGNISEFFNIVEEKFGLEPEDYILVFISSEISTEKIARVGEEATFEEMKKVRDKVTSSRAKDHLSCSMEEYGLFMGSAFSSAIVSKPAARSGFMALRNLVEAFRIEKTKDETCSGDFTKDLETLTEELKLGKKLVYKTIKLYKEFLELEKIGKPISEEFSESAKRLISQIISELVTMFNAWASKSSEEKLLVETNQVVNKIAGKVLRDHDTLKVAAIEYLEIIARQMEMLEIDKKWIEKFLNFLAERGADATILEIVDIRRNPSLYPPSKSQAYKTALYKIGLAFETTLMTLGRNHSDEEISSLFKRSERLTAGKMLTILFKDIPDLGGLINLYSKFDRSKDSDDFVEKVRTILDNRTFEGITPDVRYYTLTTLIRNFYSHEGCQDNVLNKDEALFQQTINGGLFSMMQAVRYLLNRKIIKL